MTGYLKAALCAALLSGAAMPADAAVFTVSFNATGTGLFSGYSSLVNNTTFALDVQAVRVTAAIFVGDGDTGGTSGSGFSAGASTKGVGLSSQYISGSSYYFLNLTGFACFANPAGVFGAVTPVLDASCSSVTLYDQRRYSNINFTGVIDDFSIVEGGEVGSVSVVPFIPEPATWALMLVGFGMTGYALRRRRARVVFA